MAQAPVRVLVVDDYPDTCRFLSVVLAPELEVVGVAVDGRAAIESVAALHPDIILMDYQMPVMDGLTATICIKQMPNAPKIVLFTSDELADLRRRAFAAGVDGMLQKGCAFELLRQTLLDLVAPPSSSERRAA
jgi:CheY-like chemotaxis protein